ncbi:MAG: hypothetical protein JW726_05920 [Anaerolineales bacterium]|nr:hypothetical protein [Anaerolineales bacterium]
MNPKISFLALFVCLALLASGCSVLTDPNLPEPAPSLAPDNAAPLPGEAPASSAGAADSQAAAAIPPTDETLPPAVQTPPAEAEALSEPPPAEPPPSGGRPAITPAPEQEAAVQAALLALSQSLALNPAQLSLLAVIPAQWADSTLGCAMPGQGFEEAVTEGYLILFREGSAIHEVHTSLDGTRVVVCPAPAPLAQQEGGESLAALVDLAINDLSAALGIPADQIALVSARPVTWRDGSLGCGGKGNAPQVLTPGYVILLEAGGLTYTYHTDLLGTILLCP